MKRIDLELAIGTEIVPGILVLPAGTGRSPAALLLHGFRSNKERMADSVGRSLARRGVASLAIDLPLHGAREGSIENLSIRNALALVQKWNLAVREAEHSIRVLADHRHIDAHRLAIVGYSLGAFISVVVGSRTPELSAVVLAAGGDLPESTPFAKLVRTVADPIRAVRRLAGRPLLMVNGKNDRTIRPSQARALFEAAGEPKEIHWYSGGHWPPAPAIDFAAEWLGDQLQNQRARSRLA